MATSITKTVIPAVVGPAELAARRAFVHEIELDGDEQLAIGARVELQDEAGRLFAATVTGRTGDRWEFTIQP
jgi:hypothetical protein